VLTATAFSWPSAPRAR
jgi:hypothetical protein